MPDSTMDEALRRYRIIRPFLEEGVPLSVIATRQHMTARALRFWVRRYRSRGMAGHLRLALQRRNSADRPHTPPLVLKQRLLLGINN